MFQEERAPDASLSLNGERVVAIGGGTGIGFPKVAGEAIVPS
jgi:hypothetical protein